MDEDSACCDTPWYQQNEPLDNLLDDEMMVPVLRNAKLHKHGVRDMLTGVARRIDKRSTRRQP